MIEKEEEEEMVEMSGGGKYRRIREGTKRVY